MNNSACPKKEISCRITNAILKYLEFQGHDTDALVAGLPYTKAYLKDPYNWITNEAMCTIAGRAARITDDDTIMYHVGLSTIKLRAMGGLESLLRILTGPKMAYRSLSRYENFFGKTFRFKVNFKGNERATIVMRMKGSHPQTKDSCYYTQGVLAALPTLWGLPPAELHETKCMCRSDHERAESGGDAGSETCVYELAWQPLPSWFRRLRDNLFIRHRISNNYDELEHNLRLFDHKNAELVQRNQGLTQVREIALGIDKVRTVDEALMLAVEGARDIPGVRFVLIHKLDESGKYVTTPYYSKMRRQNAVGVLKIYGIDVFKLLGENPTSKKHRFLFSQLTQSARDFFLSHKVFAVPRIAQVMDGVWPRSMCDAIQRVLNIKQVVAVPLIVDGKSWGNMIFLLDNDVPVDILEMIGAHCATAIKNSELYADVLRRMQEAEAARNDLQAALKSLEKSEEELKCTFESVREGISVADLSGRVMKVNKTAAMMHGYEKEEEMAGANCLQFFAESDQPRVVETLGRLLEVETIGPVDCLLRRKDGSTFPGEISASVIRNAAGKPLGFVAITKDITSRRQDEAALRESEEKYRAIFEQAADSFVLIDMETGDFVDFNGQAYKSLGYTREEFAKLRVNDIDIIESPGVARKRRADIIRGEMADFETQHKTKEGEIRNILVNRKALYINDKVFTMAVWHDITEHKRMEEEIHKSEKHYRLLAENVTDVIWTVGIDNPSRLTYISPSVIHLLGLTVEEAMARSMEEVLTPLSVEKVRKTLVDGQMQESSFMTRPMELDMLHKNGGPVPVEVRCGFIREADGQPVGILVVARDITERKRAERNLRANKDLIDRILATTPNAVLVVDKESRVVLANRNFYETFKKKEKEVEAKSISEVIPVEELSQAIAEAQSGQVPNLSCEFRHRLNSHEGVFVAKVLRMGQDEVLLILSDVTEEREKQERLYLTDRLASVGEMASGVAHELNNPLTSVIGLSRLLMKQDFPADIGEDLAAINSEALRAATIVRNLLTFARKHTPTREPARIKNIVDDVLKLRSYEHRVNNISVETSFPDDLPQVMVDYFQMQQVFLNIVLNAETAITEARGRGHLRITGEKVDGHIRVAFSDDGTGIPEENMGRLFVPFFTTKDVGKGTGLGLSICYGIVTAHSGRIYVKSEYGRGATFFVELPTNGHETA